jgi:hypothetical protein
MNVPAATKQRLNAANPAAVALPASLLPMVMMDWLRSLHHRSSTSLWPRSDDTGFDAHLAEALGEEEMSDHCSSIADNGR